MHWYQISGGSLARCLRSLRFVCLQPSLSTSFKTVSKEAIIDTCKSLVTQCLGASIPGSALAGCSVLSLLCRGLPEG